MIGNVILAAIGLISATGAIFALTKCLDEAAAKRALAERFAARLREIDQDWAACQCGQCEWTRPPQPFGGEPEIERDLRSRPR